MRGEGRGGEGRGRRYLAFSVDPTQKLLRKLFFVEDINILLTDLNSGGSVSRRAAKRDGVAHHDGAD